MKKSTVGVLVFVALLVGLSGASEYSTNRRRQTLDMDNDSTQQRENAKPFQAGYQYTYSYNGQISSGLGTTTIGGAGQDEPQQKAVTRIQAEAKIAFQDNQAILRLEQIRVGQANKHIDDEKEVQPMEMFDRKPLQEEKRRQLELPVQFEYRQGVVGRVQFQREDPTWSRNAKRSILNLIQVNLAAQQTNSQSNSGEQDEQQTASKGKSFTLPEITIEGDCQTTYSINKNPKSGSSMEQRDSNSQQQQGQMFNVTKTINFQQCKKIADVAYGYQILPQQPECAQCQQPWKQQQQQNDQDRSSSTPTICPQKCDPKEVKQEELERSTMLRFVLQSQQQGQMPSRQQDYAIQRAELVSQYVYKTLQTDTASQSSSAMQTVVAAKLVFRRAEQKQDEGQEMQFSKGGHQKSNTLLYDNQWDVEEKRFYQLGDESGQTSPFEQLTNKVEQTQQILRKLIQAASDKQKGIEFDQVAQLQRLVELFRMCTVDELKQISSASHSSIRSEGDKQKLEQLVADTLAMAATRNTIKVLADKITTGKLESKQAFQALKALQGLPAPSDEQAEMVLQLCRDQAVHRAPALKQTCWLTFGSVVNEVCQQKQGRGELQIFGSQTGFRPKQQVCSQEKQESYKQALMEQYQQSEDTYEKVLALKAIGNAGLENTIHQMERIITNPRKERAVRAQAIDALRRLPPPMAKKVQRVLLPIFQNTKETPEIRMAAFCMIMHTLPKQDILDQIIYTLIKERQPEVQALVYTTLKTLANSQVPSEQQIAKHLQSTLKMVNVDEQQLRSSRKYQLPIFSQEQKEGVFLNMVSVFRNSRSQLPTHVSIGLDTLLNGQYQTNSIKVSATQQGVEQWYESLLKAFINIAKQQQQQQMTRGDRTGSSSSSNNYHNDNKEELRNIFSGLKIKSRQGGRSSRGQNQQDDSYDSEDKQSRQGSRRPKRDQPQRDSSSSSYDSQSNNDKVFAMVCIRVGNVDQAILPIDQQNMPQCLKQLIRGERPSLSHLMEKVRDTQHFRLLTAINLKERSARIPTSIGVPLRIVQATPTMASIEGNLKVTLESGTKVQLNVHPSASMVHIHRMESWMPIVATGIEVSRSVEVNVPIQSEIEADSHQGLKVTLQVPQAPKTRVFGIHSLPSTYTREWDSKSKTLREPKVKSIHNQQLEQLQKDMNKKVGEHSVGLPFQLHGHYHWPAGRVSDYKKLVQLLMATENHIHLTFEPQQDATPKQIVFRISGAAFQKPSQGGGVEQGPRMDNFYSKDSAFEKAYPDDDFEDMELDGHDQRRQKLNNFLGSFQPKQMYQHSIKLVAETRGGRKQCKVQVELKASCDSQFKFCKANLDVERTPMLAQENQPWNLNAKLEVLKPQTVSHIDQLDNQKHQKMVCQSNVEWGSERKQSITLRIQGEQAISRQQRQQMEQQGLQSSYQKKRSAFLNKFDVVAEYKLQPQSQNFFVRGLELLKCQNPWNTNSQYQQSGRDGRVHATLMIDPLSSQQANISVKTPTQAVRIEAVEMQLFGSSEPIQMRPFQLVRAEPQQSHSTHQLFRRMAESRAPRAECQVDGKRVETFDGVLYKAPIGKCYSVLAKDCANEEEPQFAVMMKTIGGQQQQQQGEQMDKKIKVVTPEKTITCQPTGSGSHKKLKCQANGQDINSQGSSSTSSYESSSSSSTSVEYSGEDQREVTIQAEGVEVRFACHCAQCKCQKAWVRLSSHYKQAQCGLCGHYDDQADEGEWKMANGDDQSSQDIDQFHRSYSLLNNEDECNQEEQNNFYSNSNKNKFGRIHNKNERTKKSIYDEQEQSEEEDNDQWRDGGYQSDYSSEEQQWKKGGQRSQQQQQQRRQRNQRRSGQRQNGQQQQQNEEEPIEQTKVLEFNHKICFSTQPVKQCPEGTTPAKSNANSDEWDQDNSQQQQGGKKIQFACLSRSSVEARRLQRQARKGVQVDVSQLSPSFVEPVQQPTRCVPY